MNQKGHVFLIVLLIAAAIGGYLIYSGKIDFNRMKPTRPAPTPLPIEVRPSPVSDETANWKTYTNTKAGFSLSYPPNAVEGSREPDPFPVARQFQFSEPRGRGGGGPLSVGWLIIVSETQPNPKNLTLREWGKEKQIIYGKDNAIDPKYITIANTDLGGLPAISWKNSGGDGNITNYLVKRTNGITLVVTNIDSSLYQKNVDQILSTFKFAQ